MPTLYADASGALIAAHLSDLSERLMPAPQGAVVTRVFDAETNTALLASFATTPIQSWHLAPDGVLTKDGVPVTINPPAPAPPPAVDPAAIGAVLAQLPADQPLTKADLAPLLALFGAGAGN